MFVIEVTPLIRGTKLDTLTYYTKEPYAVGDIVTVPIRKREAQALVTRLKPVGGAKAALRAATFSLRRLPSQQIHSRLPAAILKTAEQLALEYPAQIGSLLVSLLPPEVKNGDVQLRESSSTPSTIDEHDTVIMQAVRETRFTEYRRIIREHFSHRGSVLFVVPTTADIEYAEEALSQGIEHRVVVFSRQRGKKKLQEAYASYEDLTKAKLIITTPTHAYLDRHDITKVIIEGCRSQYYKAKRRPYIDHRDALRAYANVRGCETLLADLLPRTEEEFYRREGTYITYDEHPKRLAMGSSFELIDPKDADENDDTRFTLLHPTIIKRVKTALSERKNVFVYAPRRGLAPIVTCYDCSQVMRCPDSGAPYTLMRTREHGEEQRWFVSRATGVRTRALDVCPQCGSWRLKERGVGVQQIFDTLQDHMDNDSIALFDHTTISTHKKALALVENWYDAKGKVLLGTQMALPYLRSAVPLTILTSLEAARITPSWRAEEDVFSLLLTLREYSSEACIVQARTNDDSLVEKVKKGLVEQFYNEEIELRKIVQYPPLCVFVLLTLSGAHEQVTSLSSEISSVLHGYKLEWYKSLQDNQNVRTVHGLVRVSYHTWPDTTLINKLRLLPPSVRIEVNPQTIV